MAVHHAQAVEMGFAVRDASTDGPIRALAYDIITTQTAQRGVFMGWLQQWGLDQSGDRPAMAWMAGHGGHGGAATTAGATAMPGMATPQALKRLQGRRGRAAEALFLQRMLRHHEGGVRMADAVLRLTSREEVRSMAQNIVNSQESEIGYMTELLKARGAQPYPSIAR